MRGLGINLLFNLKTMWFRNTADYGAFTLDALNEATPMQLAQDFRHIEIDVTASSVTSWYTLTVYTSNQETRPDLTSAVSTTNRYTVAQVVNLDDWDPISGSTGIVITTDWESSYEVNENKATWVWVKMTARTDGQADINFSLADNQ